MFKVKTDSETVSLTNEQLIQLLISKIAISKKDDIETLAESLANYMEVTGTLKTASPLQLIMTAFSIGYFYKVFLIKNSVEMETPSDTSDNRCSS